MGCLLHLSVILHSVVVTMTTLWLLSFLFFLFLLVFILLLSLLMVRRRMVEMMVMVMVMMVVIMMSMFEIIVSSPSFPCLFPLMLVMRIQRRKVSMAVLREKVSRRSGRELWEPVPTNMSKKREEDREDARRKRK